MSLNPSFLQRHFDSKGTSDGLRRPAPSNLWTCKDESMDWVRVRGSLSVFSEGQPTTRRCKPKRLRFRNVFSFKKYQQKMQYSNLPLSWFFKPKPSSQTTISTPLHSSSIRAPLTWCHRGIEAAAWCNGGWEVLARSADQRPWCSSS